jgi:IclR family mhp operon transcriptional activator
MTSEVEQTRSVHRALDVLEHLGEHGPASLHQLHRATRLPKSTLRRLLATLAERRFIRRGISDAMYRINIGTLGGVDSELDLRIGKLVEIARPHMLALTNEIRWPSDLHIYVKGRMRILESTHGRSPFGGNTGVPANAELNLFATASGLAFLAFQEERFVLELIADLRQSEYWTASRFGVTPGWLLAELATTRRLGYAKRRVTQGRAGGWDAIAVPIFQARAPIGGLTITWDRKLMSPERFADLHLRALQTAAEAISEDVTAG